MMNLVVITGLPGSGKSTLAEEIGRRLKIPVFAKDWLEAALLRAALAQDVANVHSYLGYAGYELLTTLAERQLQLGQSAILDSVASSASIRREWRRLAQHYDASWRVVECVCADEQAHRRRVLERRRHIPGWSELSWDDVLKVRSYYEPWSEERLVLDTMQPIEPNIGLAIAYIRGYE